MRPTVLSILKLAGAAVLAALAVYAALDLAQSADRPYRGRDIGSAPLYGGDVRFR